MIKKKTSLRKFFEQFDNERESKRILIQRNQLLKAENERLKELLAQIGYRSEGKS